MRGVPMGVIVEQLGPCRPHYILTRFIHPVRAGAWKLIRSKPIKQAGEISTRFAAVSISCKRLPLVTVGFERSSPIQKMNFSSHKDKSKTPADVCPDST